MCYIDWYIDPQYRTTKCKDLIQNIGNGLYANSQQLLNAGGNFGCWRGKTGDLPGPAHETSDDIIPNACQDNMEHDDTISYEGYTYGCCIRFPTGISIPMDKILDFDWTKPSPLSINSMLP